MNISVVIPFYNEERFFLETLKAVFAQCTEIFECIVANDGSKPEIHPLLRLFES